MIYHNEDEFLLILPGFVRFVELPLLNSADLPEIFKSEDELRELWKSPITRSEPLKKLENKGFPRSELEKAQEIINARNSDLFDVLEFIRFNRNLLTREERVLKAKDNILNLLSEKQKDFINFILNNYIKEGIDELYLKKLPTATRSKYNTKECLSVCLLIYIHQRKYLNYAKNNFI